MAQDRMIAAIGRIENALSRLEQAGQSPRGAVADDGLRQRHERLKAESKAVLSDLDALISGAQR